MPSLLDPLNIKNYTLKNRIVMPPMATELATEKGKVTDKLIKHYLDRCSGLGMLIIEHTYIEIQGKYSPRQLGIYDDELIEGLSKLVKEVKEKCNTVIIIQLNHAGGKASSNITSRKPIAPSPIMVPGGTEQPRQMTLADMKRVKNAFKNAAIRAIKAGFDGVEIHGAHGFLLNQFLSPITNKRIDAYGGTLAKRMKFPLEVIEQVRRAIGNKLLLYRLGADDMMPGGLTIEESRKFAMKLEEYGVDIIDVSGGLCGSRPEGLTGQGYFVPLAEKIKSVVRVPVIGVGGIRDPKYADEIVRLGKVDLVAVGRAILENPNWPIKAINELSKQKRH